MIDLYFCHRDKFCRIAADIGYELGTRADQFDTNRIDKLLDDGYDVSFVDNNFKDPNEDRIFEIAQRCSAEYAVCPDVDHKDDLDAVIDFGERLESIGVTPIVVPKDDLDYNSIPDHWRLGFSVPSGYGETEIPITEFKQHEVHLLGGSPQKQLEYATKAIKNDIDVVSVDGNSFAKAASYGNIINSPSKLLGDGNAWDYDITYPEDWSGRLIVSLVRNYLMWRDWSCEMGVGSF